jgi:hypothetical protein
MRLSADGDVPPTADVVMNEPCGPPPKRTSPQSIDPPIKRLQYVDKMIQTDIVYDFDRLEPKWQQDKQHWSETISISSSSSSSNDVIEISDDEDDGGEEIVGGL